MKTYFWGDSYKKMLQIRVTEESIAQDFLDRKIFSFLHLCSGQEAAAVGVCAVMGVNDDVLGNHRSHGHYLAKGGNFEKMVHEIYGSEMGCCNGIGGSMHMLDRSVGFQGSTPILGSVVPLGCGVAFSKKHKKNTGITVVYVGDGAAEEGAFYETVNLAGVLGLRLLLVIEDNRYAVATSHSDRKAPQYDLKKIVEGLGGYYCRTNGQNVVEVYETTKKIKELMDSDKVNCAVLHLDVLRNFSHSGPIKDENSRLTDHVEYRQENDPIKIAKDYLIKNGYSNNSLELITEQVINDTKFDFENTL
jgi:pyruvate dehydrogenase E1 component alpha subunit